MSGPGGLTASPCHRLTVALGAVLSALALLVTPAEAASAAHLQIDAVALPSHFAAGDESDRYEILVTNTGAEPVAAGEEDPILVHLTPLSGLVVRGLSGGLWSPQHLQPTCSPQPRIEAPQCQLTAALEPDATIDIRADVEVTAPSGATSLSVEVEAGETALAEQTVETPIDTTPAPFAIESFSVGTSAPDGSSEEQAAGQPYEAAISIQLPNDATVNAAEAYRPARNPRVISVALPVGLIANPLAAARCRPQALNEPSYQAGELVPLCPRASRIGLVTLFSGRSGGVNATYSDTGSVSPLYNLTPEPGYPAELGFSYQGRAVILYAELAYSDGRYLLRITIPGAPIIDLDGFGLTLFGNSGSKDEEPALSAPFLTNPDSCAPGGSGARLEIDSWEEPREWLVSQLAPPTVRGCDLLEFSPRVQVAPGLPAASPGAGIAADTPAGYRIDLAVPNAESSSGAPSSPRLKHLEITLPPGVSLSPAAANGLRSCAAQGPEGIDLPEGAGHPDESGPGEEIGPDGISHLVPGHCPSASTLGSVQVHTPLLEAPLSGSIYLASPACGTAAPCTAADAAAGEMVRVYLEARGPGVVIKLPGEVQVGVPGTPDLGSAQLHLAFSELPDLPLEVVRVHLNEGPRAALATPQSCGNKTSTGSFASWSSPEVQPASSISNFEVTEAANGGACPSSPASEPNQPDLEAGSLSAVAGAYSHFLLRLSRADGTQRFGSISFTMPKGLLARLTGVSRCPDSAIEAARHMTAEGEAVAPSCPAASQVGKLQILAGPGSMPLPVKGRAYLAGPYMGSPLSLVMITPALAGPFDLGTVVERVALFVDGDTAQIHAVSDPLPDLLAGVPLDIRSLILNLNRPRFTINPTSCRAARLTATFTSTLDNEAHLTSPFQLRSCRDLPFHPRLSLRLDGPIRRGEHPRLVANLRMKPGETNIAGARITLPHSTLLDDSHIRAVCSRVRFESGAGAGTACPSGSVYGRVTASTPLLDHSLTGNVYLRANPARKLPDLVAVLDGPVAQPIRIVLPAETEAARGTLRTRFEAVPDVPLSSLRFELFGGRRGLIELSAGFCEQLQGAVMLSAHNGRHLRATPKFRANCPRKPSRPAARP